MKTISERLRLGYGNGDKVMEEAADTIDALTAALRDLTPPMPPADAMCHVGILEQARCGNCQRIAAAHAALKLAETRK